MSKTLFMDLDGTLLDVFQRYYKLLCDYLFISGQGDQNIDFDTYKKIKREGKKDSEIVKKLLNIDIDVEDYMLFKKNNLESKKYLSLDTVIKNPANIIESIKKSYNLELLTVRRNKETALWQLKKLDLFNMFDNITILPPKGNNPKMAYLCKKAKAGDIVIGDGLMELSCAGELGLNGYFVNTGLRDGKIAGKTIIVCRDYEDAIYNIRNK